MHDHREAEAASTDAAKRRPEASSGMAQAFAAVQRSAGNQAVAGMVQRFSGFGFGDEDHYAEGVGSESAGGSEYQGGGGSSGGGGSTDSWGDASAGGGAGGGAGGAVPGQETHSNLGGGAGGGGGQEAQYSGKDDFEY